MFYKKRKNGFEEESTKSVGLQKVIQEKRNYLLIILKFSLFIFRYTHFFVTLQS